ncbi:hypothetical protein K439DRAFT_1355890 [Ramaria rubella]|nr:hypothetical protein K439DRAFT_1355890 [Ramaria rubella]
MSLGTLPPELYYTILSHIPPLQLQTSTLNLSRAIPLAPVPLRPLFENISITRQQQLPQLYLRLRFPLKFSSRILSDEFISDESIWVKSFTLVIWRIDADVLVNVLALLPALERLKLKIGPVFTPEHLREMFIKPVPSLNTLNLRFRPYVQTATYYQFLKGSYFDPTLELISMWPSTCSLSRVSIIQDPLPPPPSGTQIKAFAQPIVFFSLTPLTTLSISPATQKVTHVRLRIPSRQLVRFIAPASPPGKVQYPFPNAALLDLSTSYIRETSDVEALLNYVGGGRLRHLILDNTGLCDNGEWEVLGKACALAGVKHSREREKALKAWAQTEAMTNNNQDELDGSAPGHVDGRRPRRGRRGLATATISLRDRPIDTTPTIPMFLPASESSRQATKIRIMPPPPRLQSLCTNLPRLLGQPIGQENIGAQVAEARASFENGWSKGLSQLQSMWTRLRQSRTNGVRVFRLDVDGQNELDEDVGKFAGLVEMEEPGRDKAWEGFDATIQPPVLCFSGARGEDWEVSLENNWTTHPEGCGHRISWEVWDDNL